MIYLMRELALYLIVTALMTCLLSVPIIAEEEDLEFERNHNKQENPVNFWRFQISTPSRKSDYPPSFLWHSDRPFQDDILSPYFGNRIVIKNKSNEIND